MKPEERHTLDIARARFACDAAAFVFAVDKELLCERRGCARVAKARQVAMYLCHVAFGMSLHRVAIAFARDRSTVAHACQIVEDKRDHAAWDETLERLEASLRAAPVPSPWGLAA